LRYTFLLYAIIIAAIAAVFAPSSMAVAMRVSALVAASGVFFIPIFVFAAALLRDKRKLDDTLGLANRLTMIRLSLVAPLILLVLDQRFVVALVVYGVCLVTDILDGMAARKRGEQSEFGAIMDPLADILSTTGLFGALLAQGVIPFWVFIVLLTRYATLFVGSAAIFLVVGPLRFRATTVGKIVGVLQGLTGIMILALAATDLQWQATIGVTVFYFLGIIFGSVVVSQLVIGIRFTRTTLDERSQRQPQRIRTDLRSANDQFVAGER
jgi:cardiolipin synthase